MSKCKYTSIGGQALIEGIMMKGPVGTAMAVRTKDGEIDLSMLEEVNLRKKYKILALPLIRGVVGFGESLVNGYKALMLSAEKSGFTDLEEEESTPKDEKKQSAILNIAMVIGTVLGVILAIVLFTALPRFVVGGLQAIFKTEFSSLTHSFIEQFLKLAVFVLYVWLVSFMKDIRRTFMYHGAEHKTIFCYEAGLELTVENVKKQKRLHPRCGTSFLILMILVSMIVSTVVQMIFPGVYDIAWLWITAKILMLPLICGLGYELLKICGKYDNLLTRIISAPGMWLQKITTKEPEDDMIEIAIAALKACDEIEDTKPEEETENNDDI